jgi:hypothetical protein
VLSDFLIGCVVRELFKYSILRVKRFPPQKEQAAKICEMPERPSFRQTSFVPIKRPEKFAESAGKPAA